MNDILRPVRMAAALMSGSMLLACASRLSDGAQVPATPDRGNIATAEVPITPWLIAHERRAQEEKTVSPAALLQGRATSYAIGKGDVLSVVVWNHPELTSGQVAGDTETSQDNTGVAGAQGFVVDHSGFIQFPFAGTVLVEGLTETQARAKLIRALARYIKDPVVTLRIQAYRSKRIYVDGPIKVPGQHAITDIPMSLIEAINRAGGLTADADQSRLKLIRAGVTYEINLPEYLNKGINPANIILIHGDILKAVSREESKVFLTGEVITPRALLMHDGRLTLNEALGEAGGLNPLSGDASRIYVVRSVPGARASVFRLDASDPSAMALAEGFQLTPRDVVYVSPTRLANWHRAVSQLLPGAVSSAVSAVRP
jgi:polysaccharide export outer membrane protein